MTGRSHLWTRRAFAQTAALSSAAALLPLRSRAGSSPPAFTHAYVACTPRSPGLPGAIQVFSIHAGAWRPRQRVECIAPAHLHLHPTLPVLYALHDVAQWNHLPAGAVSAFTIQPQTGDLLLTATQPLALSATHPRHAVVSSDGQDLIVAAYGGGAYNVLPLSAAGMPAPPRLVRKELGRAHDGPPQSSHPIRILLHPGTGRLLTVDTGNQTIAAFDFEPDAMTALARIHFAPGQEVIDATLSPCARWVFILHASGALATCSLAASGVMERRLSLVPAHAKSALQVAIHPSGRALFTTGTDRSQLSLRTWNIDQRSGALTPVRIVKLAEPLGSITFSPSGDELLAVGLQTGSIFTLPLEGPAPRPEAFNTLAQASGAASIVLRTA